jgi:ABC-type polysaccharide/polyol phosphate export permease
MIMHQRGAAFQVASRGARRLEDGRCTTVIITLVPRIPGKHFARNLIERRTLLFQLVRRDFQQRYVGSAAGWLWGAIHPLVLLLSYYFIFEVCLKTKLPQGEVTDNYLMFLFCGFLPWLLFQDTVVRSAGSLIEHSNLITKTVFPAEVVPVSIFLSSLIHHLIALVIVIGAAAIFLKFLSVKILLLPIYMLFIGLLSVGVGWIVSSLHVYLRDTAQVLTVVMTLWFWITPIMITERQIPDRFHTLVALNPMSWVVNAYRYRLLSAQWPSIRELTVIAAYSVGVFVIGGLFFRHLKRGFADVL